MKDSPNDI
ncbi:hypothetical protein D050_3010, partial [Vibrio parahaemolyticus VPCR-2009]